VHETSRNQGAALAKYWQATSYPDGMSHREPWCAAFVAWCVREAQIRRWGSEAAAPWRRCKSAAVRGWMEWPDREPRVRVLAMGEPAKKGDIVIFLTGPGEFSHIGIVVADQDGSRIETIEGNTDESGSREGEGVYRKHRPREGRTILRVPG
jgi:hypothetical protein